MIRCKDCRHRTQWRWCKILKFKVTNNYWCEAWAAGVIRDYRIKTGEDEPDLGCPRPVTEGELDGKEIAILNKHIYQSGAASYVVEIP